VGDSRVELRTFPSSDGDFEAFARAALEACTPGDLEAFEDALRDRYPAAIVRARAELALRVSGEAIWYAFRFGAAGQFAAAVAAGEPAAGHAVIDEDRRFVSVDERLAEIVEVPASAMVGRPVEAFANPSDPSIIDDLMGLWEEFVRTGDIAGSIRFNTADGRPRELAYRLTASAAGPGKHRLVVREIPRG
jgi:PAS domain-containing protein